MPPESPAKLVVSEDGQFATLFNSTGEYLVIWSKPYGHFMVQAGIAHQVITSADARMLHVAIDSSELPDSDSTVNSEVRKVITDLNESHMVTGQELTENLISQAIAMAENRNTPLN